MSHVIGPAIVLVIVIVRRLMLSKSAILDVVDVDIPAAFLKMIEDSVSLMSAPFWTVYGCILDLLSDWTTPEQTDGWLPQWMQSYICGSGWSLGDWLPNWLQTAHGACNTVKPPAWWWYNPHIALLAACGLAILVCLVYWRTKSQDKEEQFQNLTMQIQQEIDEEELRLRQNQADEIKELRISVKRETEQKIQELMDDRRAAVASCMTSMGHIWEQVGKDMDKLESERAKLNSERAKLKSDWAALNSEKAKLDSESVKFKSDWAMLHFERATLSLERAKHDTEKQIRDQGMRGQKAGVLFREPVSAHAAGTSHSGREHILDDDEVEPGFVKRMSNTFKQTLRNNSKRRNAANNQIIQSVKDEHNRT